MKTDFNPIRQSFPSVSSPSPQVWQNGRFKRAWDRLMQYCLGNPEPRITLKRDRSGEHYWVVYDPTMNQSLTFWSAPEVRIWLEERYRR
ncbi:hypothetical protein [Leptolyngbya ohadii]|uniref:hypothetical protein n=1 Tax=Leptolyngbya ohadii TaxID=1962290 RepID=UPI000B59E730|nr:hypothetical protein [Leptolyngbya ohadii]